jgi:hypothetical protein
MYRSVDWRSVIIKAYENLEDEDTLYSVTIFSLPGEDQANLDDIPQWFIDDLSIIYSDAQLGAISGHTITDTRSSMEIGAGAFFQEIILSLAMSVGYDGVKVLVRKLTERIRAKYSKQSNTPPPLSDDIDRVKNTVQSYFNCDGQLKIVETTESVVLEDEQGNRYRADRLLDNPYSLRIEQVAKTGDHR